MEVGARQVGGLASEGCCEAEPQGAGEQGASQAPEKAGGSRRLLGEETRKERDRLAGREDGRSPASSLGTREGRVELGQGPPRPLGGGSRAELWGGGRKLVPQEEKSQEEQTCFSGARGGQRLGSRGSRDALGKEENVL